MISTNPITPEPKSELLQAREFIGMARVSPRDVAEMNRMGEESQKVLDDLASVNVSHQVDESPEPFDADFAPGTSLNR